MPKILRFEDLEIWQLARELCNDIYEIAQNSDLKTDYKLYNQIDGSSGSIMDNIAVGFERNGNKEFIQFLSISKGSCGETRSQLYRVFDRSSISKDKFEETKNKTIVLSKKISSFMTYLSKSDYKGSKYK
jgi:four helix bundle protein